jgi:hypothetical protein
MVHLLLSNEKIACGAERKSSGLIQLVSCRCHARHNTHEHVRSIVAPIELVVCSCGCRQVFPMAQAKWDEADSLPYISFEHMADHQWEKEAEAEAAEDAFKRANRDMNSRLFAEDRERRNG